LHAFGLQPLMVSRIGHDDLGDNVEAAMRSWGMDCSGLQKDPDHPTGTVEVQFVDGEPEYKIIENVAYDFIDPSQLPQLDGHWLLYHGSLALRHESSASALASLMERDSCSRFVDINLRPPWWQRDRVIKMINGADWLKLNRAELTDIFPEAVTKEAGVEKLSAMIAKQILLTGGEQGATVIETHDGNQCSVVPEQASSVVDTVGAGDAFCSVFVAGQLLGWPLDVSMQRAQAFASAIVGIRGATSQERGFYQQFTRTWGLKD
ncbi:MAG TPA: PfkB family carbohydrate kinase, partial [Mariprofundaceae bacterium]|nr:PfkB family carbohydrate kinase [Mariprofundaceae bacterium]